MEAADERDVSRMYRVVRTLRQLLVDRGYTVSAEDLNMSRSAFVAHFAPAGKINRSQMFLSAVRNETEGVMVGFFEGVDKKKIGVAPVRSFCEKLVGLKVHRGIIVHQQPLSSQAIKVIQQVSEKYRLEAFEESELIVNITHHVLVPKHELLTPNQKSELLHRYRLKESQLPRILTSDPVARYFGLRRSDVVKIIRSSETAGRYVTYRLCM